MSQGEVGPELFLIEAQAKGRKIRKFYTVDRKLTTDVQRAGRFPKGTFLPNEEAKLWPLAEIMAGKAGRVETVVVVEGEVSSD